MIYIHTAPILISLLFFSIPLFINDLFATGGPAGEKELWKATTIGNHVSIGSNATILPVSICERVVIGAGSVVTKDIIIAGYYAGNPAKLLRKSK